MRNLKIIIVIIAGIFWGACSRDTDMIFDTAPNKRMQQASKELEDLLTSQTDGWEMIYYPNVEELYSDVNRNILRSISYGELHADLNPTTRVEEGRKYLGRGGYYFVMKFLKDGKVQMLSDLDFASSLKIRESEYSISQNTFIQLSFVTPNYIFDIKQQTNFLFYKKMEDGSLVFTTNRYENENREYIVLRPLEKGTDLQKKINRVLNTKIAFENLVRFKPTITISDENGNKLFKSGVPQNDAQYTKISRRYALFLKNISPPGINNTHFVGLGSGYVALDGEIYFSPGFKWNDEITFSIFKKEGGVYISKVKGYTAIIK